MVVLWSYPSLSSCWFGVQCCRRDACRPWLSSSSSWIDRHQSSLTSSPSSKEAMMIWPLLFLDSTPYCCVVVMAFLIFSLRILSKCTLLHTNLPSPRNDLTVSATHEYREDEKHDSLFCNTIEKKIVVLPILLLTKDRRRAHAAEQSEENETRDRMQTDIPYFYDGCMDGHKGHIDSQCEIKEHNRQILL